MCGKEMVTNNINVNEVNEMRLLKDILKKMMSNTKSHDEDGSSNEAGIEMAPKEVFRHQGLLVTPSDIDTLWEELGYRTCELQDEISVLDHRLDVNQQMLRQQLAILARGFMQLSDVLSKR